MSTESCTSAGHSPADWQAAVGAQVEAAAPPFVLRAGAFARASLHGARLLDSIPLPREQNPNLHPYTTLEAGAYAVRSLRAAIALTERNIAPPGCQLLDELARTAEEGFPHADDAGSRVSAVISHPAFAPSMEAIAGASRRAPPAPPRAEPSGSELADLMASRSVGGGGRRRRVRLPALGFGTGIFYASGDDVHEAMRHAASELGYRHFDTAAGYANEATVGSALRASGVPRAELFVATKLSDPKALSDPSAHLDAALRRLQMDYVDALYLHGDWSARAGWPAVHAAWERMEQLVADGRVRHLGVCNYALASLERLYAHATLKPALLQIKFDAFHPGYQRVLETAGGVTEDTVAWAIERGIAVVGYSTLSGWPFALRAVDEPLVGEVAAAAGATPAQVLLAHAMARGLAVIPSSHNHSRLASNRAALALALAPDHARALDGLAHVASPVRGAPTYVPAPSALHA